MLFEALAAATFSYLVGDIKLAKWERVASQGDAATAVARYNAEQRRRSDFGQRYQQALSEQGRGLLLDLNLRRAAVGKPEAHALAEVIAAISETDFSIRDRIASGNIYPHERAMFEFLSSGGGKRKGKQEERRAEQCPI